MERRDRTRCKVCHGEILCYEDDTRMIVCLNDKCGHQEPSKRFSDVSDIPKMNEFKEEAGWQ
jgi:hypothetical protein